MESILQAYAEVPSIARETGYEMKTTFWGDFRVCGKRINDIEDTFRRAFKAWKDDKVYGTELALVLNWLSWYYQDDQAVCTCYVKLWQKVDAYILENWNSDDLSYYLHTTD